MFWSGNFMAVRELNFLLKDENVTLASVLEADDILQECKADNKALIQFLTRPDILAELIRLITEEPPPHMALSEQYRHPSIACEVLTSHLSTLSDRLTLDTHQMNRLCDFINKDPPLNPLLASYFSKTVEMLLERSPKQDWYLYHIVCLRVLDLFKSRRDFLPNLLRHISTSAIADTFKYFIRLDDLFNKPIMEWLEEHQFIDSLIQIVCGSYVPEHLPGPPSPAPAPAPPAPHIEEPEKGQREPSEKHNHVATTSKDNGPEEQECNGPSSRPSGRRVRPATSAPALANRGECESSNRNCLAAAAPEPLTSLERAALAERMSGVAAGNAAALLCDLVSTGCAAEGTPTRSKTAWQLGGALGTCARVRSILGNVFTCAPRHRAQALHHATRLLHTLLLHHTSESEEERCSVELAVAPHLPLLHQALLHDPQHYLEEECGSAGDAAPVAADAGSGTPRVGAARVSTAALLAALALSSVEEVATTLLTLGTPGVVVALMFSFPSNNFLHAAVVALVRNALSNRIYRDQYAAHLFVECDLLTRLMDAFEENENTLSGVPRAGYMGHVVCMLGCISAAWSTLEAGAGALPAALLARWAAFQEQRLAPVLLLHDTPLGGSYPSDNIYELDNISDTLAANYDFSDMAATPNMDDLGDDLASDHEMRNAEEHVDSAEFIADGLGLDEPRDKMVQSRFLELASQRFTDDMWDDTPEADFAASGQVSPWESGGAEVSPGGEGWAQFDAFAAPSDAGAPAATNDAPAPDPPVSAPAFAPFWPYEGDVATDAVPCSLEESMRSLRLENCALHAAAASSDLATNLLTAMSAMTPDAIANIVNANLQPVGTAPPPPPPPPAPFTDTPTDTIPTSTSQADGTLLSEETLPVHSEGTLLTEVLSSERTLSVDGPSEGSLLVEGTLPATSSPVDVTLSEESTPAVTLPSDVTLPDTSVPAGEKSPSQVNDHRDTAQECVVPAEVSASVLATESSSSESTTVDDNDHSDRR